MQYVIVKAENNKVIDIVCKNQKDLIAYLNDNYIKSDYEKLMLSLWCGSISIYMHYGDVLIFKRPKISPYDLVD